MPTDTATASFGYWVRRQRQALDLTQAELARRVGCAAVTVSKIERDERRPSRQMAGLLADNLAVPDAQRADFLAVARGERAVETLPLGNQPVDLSAPESFVVAPPPDRRSNLPAPTTPLIGRETELDQLAALLADPAHRLVTVVGPGGMGKTRLALAAAHAAVDAYPDGVFLVELTALTSADDLPRAIGESVGYPFPDDSRPLRRQIRDYLARRRMLLLLDNFEHLLDGAAFAVEMLEAAPDLRLLVASRERLHLQAETVFHLEGLTVPPSDAGLADMQGYGAVELFIERVGQLRKGYTPDPAGVRAIARICRSVDGMPLGIVLAAGWGASLAIGEIAEEVERDVAFLAQEMGDLPPRHRAISAVFEQSWQRLSSEEKTALAGLSVFARGCDRHAAQAVTGASLPVLQRLVDRSLLWRVGEGRYELHELVRQLARRKLDESGQEGAMQERHSRWYLALLAQEESRLKSRDEAASIARLEQERANCRTAWLWATQTGDVERLQRAMEAWSIFHHRLGLWDEGMGLIDETLARFAQSDDPQTRLLCGWMATWRGVFLHMVDQSAAARRLLTEQLEGLQTLAGLGMDIRPLRAFLLLHRGGGDPVTDRQRVESEADLLQALAYYEEVSDEWAQCNCLALLGQILAFQGKTRQGYEWQMKTLRLARHSGNGAAKIRALYNTSFIAEQMERLEEAEEKAREGVALGYHFAHRTPMLQRLAIVLLARGHFAEAARTALQIIEWKAAQGLQDTSLAFERNTLARSYIHLGRFEEAQAVAAQFAAEWHQAYKWTHPFFLRTLSRAVQALGDGAEARGLSHQIIEYHQSDARANRLALARTCVEYAYPALAVGDRDDARQMLLRGLELVKQSETWHFTVTALPAAALLLATEEQLTGAASLSGAIQRYPRLTNSRWYATVALDRLAELLAPLPADVRAAAEARGRGMELPELTDELLALL